MLQNLLCSIALLAIVFIVRDASAQATNGSDLAQTQTAELENLRGRASDPKWAMTQPDFLVQGEYANDHFAMQVIALGENKFEMVSYEHGLPGTTQTLGSPQRTKVDSATVAERIKAESMKRLDRTSPTLGAAPPTGATVLFDGGEQSLREHWQDGAKRTNDGLLVQGATSKDTFGDYRLHLEFRLPFMPQASGQGRGNSGVYHQGRYETQILDSFGLAGKNNETGGIYEVRDPDLNMCLPPLVWQTYDVEFTAAKFDEAGKKSAPAKLTVKLNGVLVQSEVPVPNPTRAAPLQESPEPGPIYLQDHGNPIRFKNIWVVPKP